MKNLLFFEGMHSTPAECLFTRQTNFSKIYKIFAFSEQLFETISESRELQAVVFDVLGFLRVSVDVDTMGAREFNIQATNNEH